MKLTTSVSCKRRSLLFLLLLGMSPGLMGQVSVQGQWTTQSGSMPINPVHASLLHNGKILVVAGSGNCPPTLSGCPTAPPYGPSNNSGAVVYDPVAGTFTGLTVTWDMFCNGMVPLPDGRIFINGGVLPPSYDPFNGSSKSSIFDPATNTFTDVQNMAHGRWYPTVTVLGDGRIMTFSGTDENGETNNTVELYTVGSGWSPEITSGFTPPLYPRMHLLPSGQVFYSGPGFNSALFDPSSGTWSLNVAGEIFGTRTYGTSVLLPLTPANGYDPKVMTMGGSNPATNTTEIIDLGASTLQWNAGPNMAQARIELNAVILPTGKVLALGGSANDEDSTTASLTAELYNPATNTFTTMAANVYPRLYHSNALLLPDATVWVAGSNPAFDGIYEKHMEIYQPPYLFTSGGGLATRPTITSAPASVAWGNAFTVTTPDAATISSVVLIKTGSPTHAFDMDQRMVGLNFKAGSGSLTVTAPPNQNIAPPGYYMLFLVNSSGVPSVAKFIQVIGSTTTPPPPTGVTLEQTNYATPTGTATTVPVAFPLTQTAGNLNIVVVGWNDTSASVSSMVDSRGNTYTRAVGPTSGSGLRQSIYYAKNIAAGSNTVTVTFSPAATLPDVRILEYSGLSTSNPLDVTAAASGSGTSADSGSAATTSANELIFGAGTTAGTFSVAGSGFTTVIFTPDSDNAEQKLVSSTGSYSATASLSYSAAWAMQMATFRAGSGTGNPSPTVTSITPTSGTTSGGTSITITGTGFLSGATVSLGGTAATGVTVVSSTSITATTAAHAAGAVSVVVTNTDSQSGTLSNGFTYTGGNPAPTVTSITPTSGTTSGGTSITITGTGFLSGATVKLGGTAATGVTVVSGTSITATTAAHAAGAVSVVVINTDAQSGTLSNGFTYTTTTNPVPTLTSITPSSGTTSGGTAVTITGTGFLSGATVSLGGTAATGVTVVSSTSIAATTPAHTIGAVDVSVTNTDGQKGTLVNGYTYGTVTTALGLGVPSGDPSSATVVAGQTASYTLSIGGAGMNGTASLSCSGAPKGANCTAPASEPFSATTPATYVVTVTTTARTTGALHLPAFAPVSWSWSLAFAMLGMVVLPGMRFPRRSLRRYLWLAPLTLLLFLVSCGGGGGGSSTTTPQPNPNGTPAGTYTLNVTATSGTATQTTSLTLIVQ